MNDTSIEAGKHCVLGLLPMYHASGMINSLLNLRRGVKIVSVMRFEPQGFLKALQDFKVSVIRT